MAVSLSARAMLVEAGIVEAVTSFRNKTMIIRHPDAVRLHDAGQRFNMMVQDTISPQGSQAERRPTSMAPRRRRFLVIAASLSVAVHVAAALLIVMLPRVLPRDIPPREQGTVELLLLEQKGAERKQAAQPPAQSTDSRPAPPRPPEPPKTESQEAQSATSPTKLPPSPPVADAQAPAPTEQAPVKPTEATPPPAPHPTPKAAEATTPPAQPPSPQQAEAKPVPARQAPVFDLAGTESESNAVVMGAQVLPAMPDDRFRNRPPIYPPEAERLGQQGAVVVLIHVGANGLATGVDVTQSSGVDALDQSALAAVRKWRFHPAMKEGKTIPFDMPFRFVFDAR